MPRARRVIRVARRAVTTVQIHLSADLLIAAALLCAVVRGYETVAIVIAVAVLVDRSDAT